MSRMVAAAGSSPGACLGCLRQAEAEPARRSRAEAAACYCPDAFSGYPHPAEEERQTTKEAAGPASSHPHAWPGQSELAVGALAMKETAEEHHAFRWAHPYRRVGEAEATKAAGSGEPQRSQWKLSLQGRLGPMDDSQFEFESSG